MEFVIWIGLAIAVGFWADSKGNNGFGWGVLALIISPFLAAIIFFFTSQKDQVVAEARNQEIREANEAEQRLKIEKEDTKIRENTVAASDFTNQMEKLFNLKENGLLDSSEFIERKRELIIALEAKRPRETPTDFLSSLIPLVKRTVLSQDEITEIKKYIL